MTTTADLALQKCLDAIATTFDSVFAEIEGWRAVIEQRIADAAGMLRAAELDALVENLVVAELAAPGALIIGAGAVAAPGFLDDAPWHLAWWLGHANTFGLGSADPSVRRLEAEEDPASDSFRDYTALEWWRVPAETGTRHITGPYVDYLCTDDYTLTLTMPVRFEHRLVGVVGADLYVNDVERALLPPVRSIGGSATLMNASRRVLVSTDPHRPTGSLLRDAGDSHVLPVGASSLLLVVG
ncbi:cache domain-containing protein [Salinibacterium soli]|uniref:Cache domain-containing protein n=1 Tax=Antiquaquibacter soli TaxID=3064523 RepID=A0ABT9BRH0_9MICO|nr:cache domain-containing protein [Protaetiibacter sp. WY-16]MDO7882386.1 cache domain-containing protein [Protaetiibacter sp. WY-16]